MKLLPTWLKSNAGLRFAWVPHTLPNPKKVENRGSL